MKITTNTKDFCKLLQVGGAFAGKSKLMPLATFVKVMTKGSRIKIESTDYNNSIKEYGEVDACEGDITFFVNYSDWYNYLSAVTSTTVVLDVDTLRSNISIKHDDGEIILPIVMDGAFSEFPSEENAKSFEISREVFEEWAGIAPVFCAHDSMRPVLSGMFVYAKDGQVGYCATDAAGLITNYIEAQVPEDFQFIISDSSLPVIQKILKLKSNEPVIKISVIKTKVFIKAGTTTMSCCLSEGEYPPFKMIIPDSHPIKLTFERDALINAIRRAANAKAAESNKSVLKVGDEHISISLEDVAFAKSSDEKVAASVDGEDVSICVNYALLVNCLSAIKSDTVHCQMKGSTFSIVFKDEMEPNQTVLLMPMM